MLKYRLISNENQIDVTKPILPLMLIKNNYEVYESQSIRGIMCAVIGSDYEDNEDEIDDWNLRVIYARKIAMQSLKDNINVIVHDMEKGIIKNNYAAANDDDDYEDDEDDEKYSDIINIEVSNEKDFLKSLIKLGAIVLYERIGSNQFLENGIKCGECSHVKNEICTVYKMKIEKNINKKCDSGTKCNVEECEAGSEYILIE